MTRRFFSVRRAASRKALLAATVLSLCPMIGGCVSAVDESNAFGFSQAPEPKSVEEAIQQEAASADKPASEADASSVASTGETETGTAEKKVAALVSPARASEVAQTESSRPAGDGVSAEVAAAETGTIAPGNFLTRTSSPSVAAFAEPKKNLESDRSLYASLYNQAQAKTPLRNAEAGKSGRVIVHQRSDDNVDIGANALPGVDPKSLFEIGQRASVDSELIDDIGSSYQLASLSGIARLAPSGLMIQREDVVTNCFDSNLMNLIGQIERRFKQKVVITSGFRSPSHNRRVNGAKASMHMACKAADLHVPGVNGLEVARFVRALPGRGGVGTYCHTAAIHIDVGKMRDWNWPCRRRQST